MRVPIKWVRQQYETINKKAFNGRLPADVTLHFAPIPGDLGMVKGPMFTNPADQAESVTITISNSVRGSDKLVELVLIHEMTHIAHPDWPHGVKFDREMLRIKNKVRTKDDSIW